MVEKLEGRPCFKLNTVVKAEGPTAPHFGGKGSRQRASNTNIHDSHFRNPLDVLVDCIRACLKYTSVGFGYGIFRSLTTPRTVSILQTHQRLFCGSYNENYYLKRTSAADFHYPMPHGLWESEYLRIHRRVKIHSNLLSDNSLFWSVHHLSIRLSSLISLHVQLK